MKISLILGHPYRDSFNAAIAMTACSQLKQCGHTVHFHDLHSEGFNPVIPASELAGDITADPLVRQHQEQIAEADGIVIVHPNWWGQPPAILKGWVDRVLRENIAYRFADNDKGGGIPVGLLKARTGIVLNTSNTEAWREDTVFGDPLERIWKDCIFGFCGIHDFRRRMFRIIADSTAADREGWLQQTREFMAECFPK